MELLIVGLTFVLAILMFINWSVGMSQVKRQQKLLNKETKTITLVMEEFVNELEKENEKLYLKMVDYIKTKESGLDERIRTIEEKQSDQLVESLPVEQVTVHIEDEKLLDDQNLFELSLEDGRIFQLHKQGFSSKQIAKVLQMNDSEVELAINIHSEKEKLSKVK